MIKETLKIEEYAGCFDLEKAILFFASMPNNVILNSTLYSDHLGRDTIIGIDPFLVFTARAGKAFLRRETGIETVCGNPFQVLKKLLQKYKREKSDNRVPFAGGCMGYFSYDLLNQIEKINSISYDDLYVDDICLGFYNKAIVFDHKDNKAYIACSSMGININPDIAVLENLQAIKKNIGEVMQNNNGGPEKSYAISKLPVSNFEKQAYIDMIEKAREYIRNGEIYQVNLAQRFETEMSAKPEQIFFALREASPAPFSAYLNFDKVKVISSSPERFIKINGRNIETRPIKGTRPRGCDEASDEMMKTELLNSEKEYAELTMIVDVERNDLGKICEIGSVMVKDHFVIEKYANVFHAVSTVTGRLRDQVDIVDCLLATFPGGSITGAPKIRAMELIEELEPLKRGIYTGAIGYIGFDGVADLSIAIRCIVVKDNKAYYYVGGGIVWDSQAEMEYEETLHKGSKMMAVLSGGQYDK